MALTEIQSNLVKSISTEILSSRPWPKFGHVLPEIRLKVIQVHAKLKFGVVGPDKKSVKFYGVSPIDTNLKKINLNLFYEK